MPNMPADLTTSSIGAQRITHYEAHHVDPKFPHDHDCLKPIQELEKKQHINPYYPLNEQVNSVAHYLTYARVSAKFYYNVMCDYSSSKSLQIIVDFCHEYRASLEQLLPVSTIQKLVTAEAIQQVLYFVACNHLRSSQKFLCSEIQICLHILSAQLLQLLNGSQILTFLLCLLQ